MDQYLEQIVKAPPLAKFGGLAGAVVLITLINFFMFVSPVEDRIVNLASQQRSLDLQFAEKQEIAQNLNERRREMEVLEQKLAEALTELPESRDIEEILGQMNDIGQKVGLEISNVVPGTESNAEFFARIPIKMEVTGNYHEIARFFHEMSQMRRIVNVNDINLGGAAVANDKVRLKSTFMATTFRFLDSARMVAPNGQ